MKTIQDYPTINERPPEGLKSDGTAFKVLVVDDSMFVAKQLGQILASEGYDVVATAVDNHRQSLFLPTLGPSLLAQPILYVAGDNLLLQRDGVGGWADLAKQFSFLFHDGVVIW